MLGAGKRLEIKLCMILSIKDCQFYPEGVQHSRVSRVSKLRPSLLPEGRHVLGRLQGWRCGRLLSLQQARLLQWLQLGPEVREAGSDLPHVHRQDLGTEPGPGNQSQVREFWALGKLVGRLLPQGEISSILIGLAPSLMHSHWSSTFITAFSLVEYLHYCILIGREFRMLNYFHDVATPAQVY